MGRAALVPAQNSGRSLRRGGVYTVLGDGCVDFEAALRPVAGVGYTGWLIVEAK